MDRRVMIAAAVAIAALGFGGGALTMHLADTHRLATGAAPGQAAPADQGLSWPFFGKPRAASAARAAPPKPDGFAVWKQRIDTSRPDAQGCIEMSRQLDPTRSYADFVLVSPTSATRRG